MERREREERERERGERERENVCVCEGDFFGATKSTLPSHIFRKVVVWVLVPGVVPEEDDLRDAGSECGQRCALRGKCVQKPRA